jgi:hypothetical protein
MLDQSNLSVQRCRLIFWVECSVGGYLALAKTICVTFPAGQYTFLKTEFLKQNDCWKKSKIIFLCI